jgi:hypothetical protein
VAELFGGGSKPLEGATGVPVNWPSAGVVVAVTMAVTQSVRASNDWDENNCHLAPSQKYRTRPGPAALQNVMLTAVNSLPGETLTS